MKNTIEYTPENIIELEENYIFVFGSNLAGRHGAGAAKLAKDKFDAEYGVGEGLTGRCYAFPSLDENLNQRTEEELKESVMKFIECVENNRDKIFLVTKIGCGLAGYDEEYMKKIFSELKNQDNVILPYGWKN